MRQPSPSSDAPRFAFDGKLRHFPERVEAVVKGDAVGALSVVYLDVNTDLCNHRCSFCDGFYRELRAASLPWPRLERLVEEMRELGVLSVVLAGDRGEPLLHPNITQLMETLWVAGIRYGLYTNGTVDREGIVPVLGKSAWVRFSADAATAETHRRMHVYPAGRDDFGTLVRTVERVADVAPDVGVSFVLDADNVHEIVPAADLFLSLGARFIEYKPKYLPEYEVDSAFLGQRRSEIEEALEDSRQRWGERVVLNNQVRLLLSGDAPRLRTPSRPCLTSLLRLVISTHGCYTCTPYRGESARRCGDILASSLEDVLRSHERSRLIGGTCKRLCAYHEQNEQLLRIVDGDAFPSAKAVPEDPQAYFV